MKITIDTKHDSAEEIHKAIRLLSSLVSRQPPEASSESKSGEFDLPSEQGNVFGNVFGNDDNDEPVQTPEKEDEMPRVIQY